MNCRSAQAQIALSLGEGADGERDDELRDHLAACLECRAHLHQMRLSLSCLHAADMSPNAHCDRSLWPALAARLPERQRPATREAVLRWSAAAAVLAAWVFIGLSMSWRSGGEHGSEGSFTQAGFGDAESRSPSAGWSGAESPGQFHPLWPARAAAPFSVDGPPAADGGRGPFSAPLLVPFRYRCPHCGEVITGDLHVVPAK